ncbi:MAG: hypothetical protein AABY64_03820 [Bdellovibrionota bacterium]
MAFAFFTIGPSSLGQMSFVQIHKTLTIKTNKNLPPYIAYEATQSQIPSEKSEWDLLTQKPSQPLLLNKTFGPDPRPFAQKIVLQEVVIQKEIQTIRPVQFNPSLENKRISVPIVREDSEDWKNDLTPEQKERVARIDVSEPQVALPIFQKAEATRAFQNKPSYAAVSGQASTRAQKANEFSEKKISGIGTTQTTQASDLMIASNSPDFDTNLLKNEIQIMGHIEIHKGLAITNEHHIELRRKEEGVSQERGEIDLQKGTYSIRVLEPRGSLTAQLVSKNGQIIGEGAVRIAQIAQQDNKTYQGPKIRIFPKSEMSGQVLSAYKTESKEPAPEKTKVTFLDGSVEFDVKKDGQIQYDSLIRGSSTLLRAQAPGFAPTQQIVTSGNDFQSILFPESMISSFKNIVSEQRHANYNDPKVPVIWGQVLQDGHPVAGLQVSLEAYDSADIIYFNELHLPDPSLTATSTQGGFAILNPPLGFQSLLVTRGDVYYAHQNTIVDEGVTSFVRLETSLKTENASVKVYDAFTGQAQRAELTIQGLSEKIFVEDGYQNILLPQVSQLSLLEASPAQGYLVATYLYNEAQGYIHVPLISDQWISWVSSQLRISQSPARSLIIGFVPDEEFEISVLNSEDIPAQNIVYFDSQGQIVKSKIGTAGGGFIIFNAPVDVLEVSAQLVKSQKTMSRVIPAQSGKVTVLSYRTE